MPPRKKQALWLTREELIAKVDEEMKMASAEHVADLVIEKQKQVGMVRPHPDDEDCAQYLCWTSGSISYVVSDSVIEAAPAQAGSTGIVSCSMWISSTKESHAHAGRHMAHTQAHALTHTRVLPQPCRVE